MLLATQTVSIGDFAPLFGLFDHESEKACVLRDKAGSPILLLFYAHDDNVECQEIACTFRDLMPTFDNLGVQVYSISLDSPEARKKFAEEHNIPFKLLSDKDYSTSLNYGVCKQEKRENESFFTYSRTVFLLDANLRVMQIYPLANFSLAMNMILHDVQTRLPQPAPQYIKNQAPGVSGNSKSTSL